MKLRKGDLVFNSLYERLLPLVIDVPVVDVPPEGNTRYVFLHEIDGRARGSFPLETLRRGVWSFVGPVCVEDA